MKDQSIIRDERTIAVENSSYRWAYLLLSFGLLLVVAYRSFLWRESSWDLMALVVLGGVVTTLYQWSYRVLSRRWLFVAIATGLLAAVIAALIVFIR
jgi:hypothetical protein